MNAIRERKIPIYLAFLAPIDRIAMKLKLTRAAVAKFDPKFCRTTTKTQS